MARNNLLLQRSGFHRPERNHDGKVILMRSNFCWGSDGLKSCFTPVKSPQSNGMSEAFVKTLKRDYVRANPLPDAKTVSSLIGTF
jgi:transposase InsO family protein